MKVEICTFSLESSLTAERAGADRIELCGGFAEGGTTPSAGLIKLVCEKLNIPVYVMIRPRGGDFCYSETEFATMQEDILMAKSLGAKGLVFGILLANGQIDVARTKILVELAKPMGITFHRAFDMSIEPLQALEDIIATGCERILTSGQEGKAIDGIELLKKLIETAQNRIEIMAGSGVNEQNVQTLLNTGVHAVHLSAKKRIESPMQFRQPNISMASEKMTEYERYETDLQSGKTVVELCKM